MALQKPLEHLRAQGLIQRVSNLPQDAYAIEENYVNAFDGGTTPTGIPTTLSFFSDDVVQTTKIKPSYVLGFKAYSNVKLSNMSGSPAYNQPGLEAESIEQYLRACPFKLIVNGTEIWNGPADALHAVSDEEYVALPSQSQLERMVTVNCQWFLRDDARNPGWTEGPHVPAPNVFSFEGKWDVQLGVRLYLLRTAQTVGMCKPGRNSM